MNWKGLNQILGFSSGDKAPGSIKQKKPRAKKVDFYYSNLINSLVLFASTPEYLETLEGPMFHVMSELEAEIDYAYTPLLFEEIFDKGLINPALKKELLQFKEQVDNLPNEIWTWKCVCKNFEWAKLRDQANILLDQLSIESRVYNEDFTTIYGRDGIIKESKYDIE